MADVVDDGYKLAVGVLIPLNHDRYKAYFTQFIVLHFGLFAAMNNNLLPNMQFAVPILCAVGVILSFIWLLTLMKINADISELWGLVEDYEKENKNLELKTHKSRSKFPSSGKLMISVPILIGLVHLCIIIFY
jgi:hypothetical protein